jgi:hypothetical protein
MAAFFIDWVLVEWNNAFDHEHFGLPGSPPPPREVDERKVNRLSSAPGAEQRRAGMCVLPGAAWQADAAA